MKAAPRYWHEGEAALKPTDRPDPRARENVELLFRDHARFVASFLVRLGVAPPDVDDGVQEVFTVAYRKGGFTPERATARTWLGAIAVRVASNRRRSARLRREQLEAEPAGHVPDEAPSAQHVIEMREALRRVDGALASLDLAHRAVFVLFELEGEDCAAIAQALDLPIGTVYSRLHTARKRFISAHEVLEREQLAPSQHDQRVRYSGEQR